MSDKRYKWLLLAVCITTVIVAAIWKTPDVMRAQVNRQNGLGEYVYLDYFSIIHVSRKCPKLYHKDVPFTTRMKVSDLQKRKDKKFFCPNCVNDKDYETLNNEAE